MSDNIPESHLPDDAEDVILLINRTGTRGRVGDEIVAAAERDGCVWVVPGAPDCRMMGRGDFMRRLADRATIGGERVAFGQLAKAAILPPGAVEALAAFLIERGEMHNIDGAPLAHGLNADRIGFASPPKFWAALELLAGRNADFAAAVSETRALSAQHAQLSQLVNAPRRRR